MDEAEFKTLVMNIYANNVNIPHSDQGELENYLSWSIQAALDFERNYDDFLASYKESDSFDEVSDVPDKITEVE